MNPTRRLDGVRVLVIVNVDWFFLSHRRPIVEAAVAEGASVLVATHDTGRLDEIRALGAEAAGLSFSRSGTGAVELMRSAKEIAALVRRFRPDVVHNVTIKPVLIGTAVTRLLRRRTPVIDAISGFGFALESDGRRLLRRSAELAYRLVLRSSRVTVLVQNDDARATLVDRKMASSTQITKIEGSGVDCRKFRPGPSLRGPGPVRVTLAARMLTDKGVIEFCRACAEVKLPIEAILVGPLDVGGNPTAIDAEELDRLCAETGVHYVGEVKDMAAMLRGIDVFVLPSYHEGLSKALLEAAATGLPLVSSDIAGSRPVVHDEVNGLLVPVGDVGALRRAIERLAGDSALRAEFGAASRTLALERFAIERVVEQHLDLYERVVSG